MNDRNMPKDVAGNRKVLGDLTNSYGKRGLHLAPGKFVIGNGIGVVESHLEKRILDSVSKKRVCRGPESLFNGAERISGAPSNSLNEKQKSWKTWMLPKNKDGPKFSASETHLLPCSSHFNHHRENIQENERTSSTKLPKKAIALRAALNPGLHYIRGKALNYESTADQRVGNDCASAISVPMGCDKTQSASVLKEGFKENISVSYIDEADGTSLADCPLESRGLDNIDFMKLNKGIYQDSEILNTNLLDNCCTYGTGDLKSTSVDKPSDFMHIANTPGLCTRYHDSTSGVTHGNKSCFCNFCLKASYIWADILSQDVRGRLAELGKSIRLAKTLAEKDYFRDFTRGCSERSLKHSRMDFDLAQRWKSLFVHTANALHCEGAQMQVSLAELKELTANCKRDLDSISMVPPNLPEASGGSD